MIVSLQTIKTLQKKRMLSSMSLDKKGQKLSLIEKSNPLTTLKEKNKLMLFVLAVVLSWTVEPALESPP